MNIPPEVSQQLQALSELIARNGQAAVLGVIILLLAYLAARSRRGRAGRSHRAGANRRAAQGWTPRVVSSSRDKPLGPGAGRNDLADPHVQMEAIHAVSFEVQRLLNRSEAKLLPVLENTVREIGKGHRVMAQVSLGEVIRPSAGSEPETLRRAAYASINSKRLDFGIFDDSGRLRCAIEYQGAGHYQNRAFMRDAVKREAVRKAGVAWIEVHPGERPSQLDARVRHALGEPGAPDAAPPDRP